MSKSEFISKAGLEKVEKEASRLGFSVNTHSGQ